jgi:hypothetical protein
MINDKLMLAFSVLNAVFLLTAAILAFVGAKVGKNDLKKSLGWIYSAGFIFWMLIILQPGPNFLLGVCFVIWFAWAAGVIKDLANVRS